MLRVHFFSSAYQRQLLVDRKVGDEEYGSMWLKILPHIKPVVSQCDYHVFSQEQVEERRGGFQPDHEKRKIH